MGIKKNVGILVAVLGAMSHTSNFLTIFLAGSGALASCFAALNLTYYLIECYMEVCRTWDEPKTAKRP